MKDRLRILYENSVIEEKIYTQCVSLHDGMMETEGLIDLPAYQVAFTHLAMALQRISTGDIVADMDAQILGEITGDPLFSEVKILTDKVVSHFGGDLPESEIHYLWLHFLNLLNEKRGG